MIARDQRSELTEQVIGLAMKVHRVLGPGFVEFVYRNALIHELRKAHIKTAVEKPMKVFYEQTVVGEFKADLVLEDWLVCELKAIQALAPEHEVQLVNYLTATGQDFGLLMNFGTRSLQVKRKYRRVCLDRIEEDGAGLDLSSSAL
jgi:GxxExxY protein